MARRDWRRNAERRPAAQTRLRCESVTVEPIDATVVGTSRHPSWRQTLHLQFDRRLSWGANRATPRDRRLWECYEIRATPASVHWRDGDATRTIRGALLNISGGGAAFGCDIVVPMGVAVWLWLDLGDTDGDELAPVASRVVAVTDDGSGLRIAHLQFVGPCPIPFFDLAVHHGR